MGNQVRPASTVVQTPPFPSCFCTGPKLECLFASHFPPRSLNSCARSRHKSQFLLLDWQRRSRNRQEGWQRALRRLLRRAKIKKADGTLKRCHPHMFRDTFAVELLLSGVPIDQVSLLPGHSSVKVTEKHYVPFAILIVRGWLDTDGTVQECVGVGKKSYLSTIGSE